MKQKLLTIITTLLILACNLSAEEAGKMFEPNISYLNNYQKRLFSDLEIQKEFLEGRFSKPSTELWKQKARLMEEYVDLFCYDSINLKSIEHSNPNLSKACRHYLNQLDTYYPEHPLSVCASKGLKSKDCQNSYLKQAIGREGLHVNNVKTEFSAKLLELRQASSKIDPAKLQKKLEALQIEFKKEETAPLWLELKSTLTKSINYYCQDVDSAYVDFMPPDYTYGENLLEFKNYTSDQLYKAVYDLLNDQNRLGNMYARGEFRKDDEIEKQEYTYHPFEQITEAEKEKFTPKPFWRIRTISEECYEQILIGIEFNPGLEASACALHGKRSPFCIYATRNLNKYLPTYITKPKKEKPTYQLDSF